VGAIATSPNLLAWPCGAGAGAGPSCA